MANGFIKLNQLTDEGFVELTVNVSLISHYVTIIPKERDKVADIEGHELTKTFIQLSIEKNQAAYVKETVEDIDRLIHNANVLNDIVVVLERIADLYDRDR